jgi:hypothetical protein
LPPDARQKIQPFAGRFFIAKSSKKCKQKLAKNTKFFTVQKILFQPAQQAGFSVGLALSEAQPLRSSKPPALGWFLYTLDTVGVHSQRAATRRRAAEAA